MLNWFCFVCFHIFKQLVFALSLSAHVCRKLYGTLTYLAPPALTNELSNTTPLWFSNKILLAPVAGWNRNRSTVLSVTFYRVFQPLHGVPGCILETWPLFSVCHLQSFGTGMARGVASVRRCYKLPPSLTEPVQPKMDLPLTKAEPGRGVLQGAVKQLVGNLPEHRCSCHFFTEVIYHRCFYSCSPKHLRGISTPWPDFTCQFFPVFGKCGISCAVTFIGWVSEFKKGIADYIYLHYSCFGRRLQIKQIWVVQKLVFLLKFRPNRRRFMDIQTGDEPEGRVGMQTHSWRYPKSRDRDLQLQNSFQGEVKRNQVKKAPA